MRPMPARLTVIMGRATSITASSWAWAHGPTGAMATAGATIASSATVEDAISAVTVEAGADAVGFVFHEKSPRNITVEAAREIVEKLPEGVEKVGVFVELESEQIREIVLAVGLSAVQ